MINTSKWIGTAGRTNNVFHRTLIHLSFYRLMGGIYFLRHTASGFVFGFASINIVSFYRAQLVEFDLKNHTEGSLLCISQNFSSYKVL